MASDIEFQSAPPCNKSFAYKLLQKKIDLRKANELRKPKRSTNGSSIMIHFPILSGRAYVVMPPDDGIDAIISGSCLLFTLAKPDSTGTTEKIVRLPANAKWHYLGKLSELRQEDTATLVFPTRQGLYPDYTADNPKQNGLGSDRKSVV